MKVHSASFFFKQLPLLTHFKKRVTTHEFFFLAKNVSIFSFQDVVQTVQPNFLIFGDFFSEISSIIFPPCTQLKQATAFLVFHTMPDTKRYRETLMIRTFQ